jgi:flagellar hook assembly protein FlgD
MSRRARPTHRRGNIPLWNGRDETSRPAPNGAYHIRVVATTEEGESVLAVRTVRVQR